MKDLFINFLKEHNLYYRFRAYYSFSPEKNCNSFEEYLEKQDPVHYITGAFPWSKTDEGQNFWQDMDGCWDKCREKYKEWSYTITFKSSKLNDSELIRDVAKLLEEKYGVKASGNLKTSSVKLS